MEAGNGPTSTMQLSSNGRDGLQTSLHVLTLNCWGLKFISKYRTERLTEVGNQIAAYTPALDIVGLQECWTYHDYLIVRELTKHVLPFGKFYNSGIFGGGLVILSRFPIIESFMFRYPLNGRPTAFFRGDWFVGKGVACTKLLMPDQQVVEVFNTHLHAPYEREPNDSYICHRTAQAWDIAKLMQGARARGSLVIGLGDFNMVPLSFAHLLIEARGGVKDVWRELHPSSSVGASIDAPEIERRRNLCLPQSPDVEESLFEHGHTCDTIMNTWRWNEAHRKGLEKGIDRRISLTELDPKAKRLDYIFFGVLKDGWQVTDVKVVLTGRHPKLLCSLSDHFAVAAVVTKTQQDSRDRVSTAVYSNVTDDKVLEAIHPRTTMPRDFYQDILNMINIYTLRERKQRRWRLGHFVGATAFTIGSWIAIWWSRYNYVAFIILFVSTLLMLSGTVDGLIGGLFVGSELRALSEFEWEVRNALYLAGGPDTQDQAVRDWYD